MCFLFVVYFDSMHRNSEAYISKTKVYTEKLHELNIFEIQTYARHVNQKLKIRVRRIFEILPKKHSKGSWTI